MTKFEQYMLNPGNEFRSPAEIVEHAGLSPAQKVQILNQWKNEVEQLQAATAENMPGPIPEGLIKEINQALAMLARYQAPDDHS
jgi:hypothetical protein